MEPQSDMRSGVEQETGAPPLARMLQLSSYSLLATLSSFRKLLSRCPATCDCVCNDDDDNNNDDKLDHRLAAFVSLA